MWHMQGCNSVSLACSAHRSIARWWMMRLQTAWRDEAESYLSHQTHSLPGKHTISVSSHWQRLMLLFLLMQIHKMCKERRHKLRPLQGLRDVWLQHDCLQVFMSQLCKIKTTVQQSLPVYHWPREVSLVWTIWIVQWVLCHETTKKLKCCAS